MIHDLILLAYRLIVLLVLVAVVRAALSRENNSTFQITAVVLAIPLVLRLFMIK
jgi:hypothetical protein